MKQCTFTNMFDRLEKPGLVRQEPNPDDRRSFLIHLTDRGRELTARLNRLLEKLVGITAGFPPREEGKKLWSCSRASGGTLAACRRGDRAHPPGLYVVLPVRATALRGGSARSWWSRSIPLDINDLAC